ncbi:DUF4062 domain-containing protein [Frankia sp. AgKG'84/4]
MTAWRVFLSHTSELRELPEDRSFVQAAEDAVIRLEHVPIDMSRFAAEDGDPAEMCRRRVGDCELYVGIIGFRYGSPVVGREEVSYTELEFDTATALGIERLVFLLEESRTVGLRRLFHDPLYWKRQEVFRQRLLAESRITVKRIATPAELERELLLSLGEARRRREMVRAVAPAEEFRPIYWVPDLTSRIVDRPRLLTRLVDALTAPGAGSDSGARSDVVGVHGTGGFGKSTLALMACRHDKVRLCFPDGVLWTDVGQDLADAQLAEKINGLSRRLGDEHPASADPMQAGMRLGELLADRRILLVIDDVWSPEQLTPFRQGGVRCHRLVTTRDRATLPLDCSTITVDLMQLDQAVALLMGRVEQLSAPDAQALAERCGRWPLLLRLIAGHLYLRISAGMPVVAAVEEATRDLDEAGPTAFDELGRAQAIAATVEASLRLLREPGTDTGSPLDRYLELVAFPRGTVIPLEVLEVMWRYTAGWLPWRTGRFCDRLAELSLIRQVRGDAGGPVGVRLHDVMHRYIRDRVGPRLRSAHADLLAAYRAELAEPILASGDRADNPPRGGHRVPWWRLPRSNFYLWKNLPLHLDEAGEHGELVALAHDLRWAAGKIHMFGSVMLEADMALLPEDPAAQALGRLARQTANLHQAADEPAVAAATLAVYAAGVDVLTTAAQELIEDLARPSLRPTVPPLPDQPDPALARTLTGHLSQVTALVLAPGSSWLASGGGGEFFGGGDGTVRIWSPRAGLERATLPGHPGGVSGLVASPDGSWLASAGRDGSVRVWDVHAGAETVLGTHAGRVSALVIAPDGSWLASGGLDATVRIWHREDGRRTTLTGHGTWVSALAVAPNGSWLASGGSDGTVRIWNPLDGTQLAVLAAHTGWVSALAVAPDCSWLASAGGDHVVRVWDPASRVRDQTSSGELAALDGHVGQVSALVSAPDGSWLASGGGDGSVRVWNPLPGAELNVLAGHAGRVSALVAAPDSTWLASADGEGTVRVWEPRAGYQRAALTGHPPGFVALAVADSGGLLASAGGDGMVRIWDPAVGSARRPIPVGSIADVAVIAVAPDGSWVATGTRDGAIRRFDPRTGIELTPLAGHTAPVDVLAIAPDGTWMASADGEGTVRIWDTATGTARAVLDGVTGRTAALAIAADSAWLAAGAADGTVRIWDPAAGGELAALAGHAGRVTAIVVAPNGSWLATGATDGTVRVWDPIGRRELQLLAGHTSQVSALAVAPDAGWLCSGSVDATVRVWDPVTGRQMALLGGHVDSVVDLATAPDGSWFASVGRDHTLRVWDPLEHVEKVLLAGHTDDVPAVAVAPDGRWIAAAGRDGTVRIWDPNAGTLAAMIRLNARLHACAWTPSGDQVILGGARGLYLLDLLTEDGPTSAAGAPPANP